MRPLSMLALSRLDIASTVQLRRALRLELVHLRPPSLHFSSVASSEQSFNRFINRVKYLQIKQEHCPTVTLYSKPRASDSQSIWIFEQTEDNWTFIPHLTMRRKTIRDKNVVNILDRRWKRSNHTWGTVEILLPSDLPCRSLPAEEADRPTEMQPPPCSPDPSPYA